MKGRIVVAVFLLMAGTVFANEPLEVKPNTYGHGVHSDQYGRPVKLVPAFTGFGQKDLNGQDRPFDPNTRIQKKDGYGHGVHMDQYGRPVKAKPAW